MFRFWKKNKEEYNEPTETDIPPPETVETIEQQESEGEENMSELTYEEMLVSALSGIMPKREGSLKLMCRFKALHPNLNALYKFARFLQNRDSYGVPTIVFVEHSVETENTRYYALKATLRSLIVHYNDNSDFLVFKNSTLKYFNNNDYIDVAKTVKSLSEAMHEGEHERTFLEFLDVGILLNELVKQPNEIVKRLFSSLSSSSSSIVYGTKSELKEFSAQTGLTPSLYFNLDVEYSNKEVTSMIASYFDKRMKSASTKKSRAKLVSYLDKVLDRKDEVFIKSLISELKKLMIQKGYDGFNDEVDFSLLKFATAHNPLENVIGLDNVKDMVLELESFLEFQNRMKSHHDLRVPLSLHMAFKGPAGTGKTTVAREIAKVLYRLGYVRREEIVEVAAEDLVSQYVGNSAIKTSDIMKKAMGGVLFVDEAYAITNNKHGYESLAAMIKIMEDNKDDIVVIFAGYKDELDGFINENPGLKSRIGYHFDFKDYSPKELVDILKIKAKTYNLTCEKPFLDYALSVFEEAIFVENFGNGRYVDNFLQKSLFSHSLMIKKYPDLNPFTLYFDYEKANKDLNAPSSSKKEELEALV